MSKSPISTPIVTAASVAAACASERPKSSRTCGRLKPEQAGRESSAAVGLPTKTTTSERAAIAITRRSVNAAGSMSIPVERRKKGMSSTPADELDLLHEPAPRGHEPVQRESGEEGADDPLDPRPVGDERGRGQRDERRRGSARRGAGRRRRTPSASPTAARRRRRARGARGRPTTSRRTPTGRASLATEPATTASTESASVSVMTVPPPAIPTARSRKSPCSWTIGYATSVCDAQSDPKSIAVARP